MKTKVSLSKAKSVAQKAALKAGKYIKKNRTQVKVKGQKDRQDIVTNIDLGAEKIIIDLISNNFPTHNIISEETGSVQNQSDYTWVIDPLDGTKEYFRGLPFYATCIALQSKKEILAGCVYIPETNEIFSAAKGLGSFKNGVPIQVSTQNQIDSSFITCHPPNYKVKEPKLSNYWQTIIQVSKKAYRVRPTSYDNIYLPYLAQGGFEAYFVLIEEGPKWWDLAPGIIIAQEAGAVVTNLKGDSLNPGSIKGGVVVSNGLIHTQLLNLLNK